MRHPYRAAATRGVPTAISVVAVLGLILAAPAVPLAQQAADSQPPAEQQAGDPESGAQPSDGQPLTFLDSVTVSATLRPAPVMQTPGTVTVIDDAAIQGRMFDLVSNVSLAEDLTLRLGVLNLTDAKYFEWWNVRNRPADDPVIDRYSSPGVSFVGSLGYDW